MLHRELTPLPIYDMIYGSFLFVGNTAVSFHCRFVLEDCGYSRGMVGLFRRHGRARCNHSQLPCSVEWSAVSLKGAGGDQVPEAWTRAHPDIINRGNAPFNVGSDESSISLPNSSLKFSKFEEDHLAEIATRSEPADIGKR
jgi:hypothetical protein